MRVFLALSIIVAVVGGVGKCKAHEPGTPHYDWYKRQQMTPETKQRLGKTYTSCCDKGDHYPTKFRLTEDGSRYGAETYEYLAPNGAWKRVNPDIIQRKKTPDGKPVLFILATGEESCLIIDDEGI